MIIYNIHFLEPLYFSLIFLIPIILYFYVKLEKKKTIKLNFSQELKNVFSSKYFYFKLFLMSFILFIFIIILANPNILNVKQNINKKGIDIVIVLDISKSMGVIDLKPSRIEKAKQMLISFIEKQKTNRLGLVLFAEKPILSIPLTFDYGIINETLNNISKNRLLKKTAIGDGLLLSKNLFKKQKREKVIILVTDGDKNEGSDTLLVSKLLAKEEIKVYTVGIGSDDLGTLKIENSLFDYDIKVPPLNEKLLKEISKITSGKFYRADSNYSIVKAFNNLENLEKNDIEVEIIKYEKEYYSNFIYLLILLIGFLLFMELKRIKN